MKAHAGDAGASNGFTDEETAEHLAVIERVLWARRRPPVHLRDRVREGQRVEGRVIEVFLSRPAFRKPEVWVEESIARLRWVQSRRVWRIHWKRADGKWHGYEPMPGAATLEAALEEVQADPQGCFFG